MTIGKYKKQKFDLLQKCCAKSFNYTIMTCEGNIDFLGEKTIVSVAPRDFTMEDYT